MVPSWLTFGTGLLAHTCKYQFNHSIMYEMQNWLTFAVPNLLFAIA